MNEFIYNYREAENEIRLALESSKKIIHLSAVELFFEDAQKREVTNQVVQKQSSNHIQNAINKVKNAIANIIGYISDFINRIFMSKEDVSKFNVWKQKMEKNPEFRNKRLTISNWKAINKVYSDQSNKIDQSLKQIETMRDDEVDGFVNKVIADAKSAISKAKSSANVIVTTDFALKAAESNKGVATLLKKALKNDESILEDIERNIGKKEAKKFQRDININGGKLRFLNFKTWMHKDQAKGMSDNINETFQGFMDLFNPENSKEANIKRLKQKKTVDKMVGAYNAHTGSNETTFSAGVKAVRGAMKAKKAVNTAKDVAGWASR